jgi:glycosyltransferase involved in cell wall biosynthesis
MPHSARFPSPNALRPLLGAADILLTDTHAEFDELRTGGWAPDVAHQCVGVGIPDEAFGAGDPARARARFGLSNDRPVISFVARLTAEKGVLRLLRAAARLADAGHDFDLVLLGDDASIRTNAEWRHLRLQLGDRVRAPGSVSIETVRDVCAASAVMAMPSVADSFGIVYLEAWAQGTPVIGVDVPAMREIIDGGGWLVPRDDPGEAALTHALRDALTDTAEQRRHAEVGRQRAWSSFRWRHVVDRIEAALADVSSVS